MHELQIVDAAELAAAYAAAEYGVLLDGETLPLQVGLSAVDLEAYWPAERYLFISAWNPASRPRGDAANRAADTALVRQLHAAGIKRLPALAQDREAQWREPGWLLADVAADVGLRLAQGFGQAGVLMWDRGRPVRLQMIAPRPVGSAALYVDWIE